MILKVKCCVNDIRDKKKSHNNISDRNYKDCGEEEYVLSDQLQIADRQYDHRL